MDWSHFVTKTIFLFFPLEASTVSLTITGYCNIFSLTLKGSVPLGLITNPLAAKTQICNPRDRSSNFKLEPLRKQDFDSNLKNRGMGQHC